MNPEIENSLREALAKKIEQELTEKGYLVAGHGTTSKEVADKILEEGITGNPGYGLYEMTLPLTSSEKDAQANAASIVDESLHWKHKSAGYVVLVAVRPEIARKEMLVENVEVSGKERARIPSRFIRGYVDALNLSFVSNPHFEQDATPVVQTDVATPLQRGKNRKPVDVPTAAPESVGAGSGDDVW